MEPPAAAVSSDPTPQEHSPAPTRAKPSPWKHTAANGVVESGVMDANHWPALLETAKATTKPPDSAPAPVASPVRSLLPRSLSVHCLLNSPRLLDTLIRLPRIHLLLKSITVATSHPAAEVLQVGTTLRGAILIGPQVAGTMAEGVVRETTTMAVVEGAVASAAAVEGGMRASIAARLPWVRTCGVRHPRPLPWRYLRHSWARRPCGLMPDL
jgi:hypothetical protein